MDQVNILWVDDEVDLLRPHILFLESKGYAVDTINNGHDALEMVESNKYDVVLLDENMPGITGIETLSGMKRIQGNLPIIMITKSEEESIMEDAIGSQISDYLIKPVNPNQILLSLKKVLDSRRLVSEKTTMNYQQEFRKLAMDMAYVEDIDGWKEMYSRLLFWELALDDVDEESFVEILADQKSQANSLFSDFIEENYQEWMSGKDQPPVMSHNLLEKKVFPKLGKGKPVFLFVIDNLRYDQLKVLQPELEKNLKSTEEDMFVSILPTATQYARNAIFAGRMPLEIKKKTPQYWVDEAEDKGKNLFEEALLRDQLDRNGMGNLKMAYHKITNLNSGKKLADKVKQLLQNDLVVVVYNFVDMLSHAKTEMEVIKELAETDKAYRSITNSWFSNSPLSDMLRQLSTQDVEIAITTDHGTINVGEPAKIIGPKSLNTNLRYKIGTGMSYDQKEVYEVLHPEKIHLPKQNISDKVVFAKRDLFFAYPNNFNHYVKYYRNTFQHGGISLEEMLIPFVWMTPR